MKNRARKKRYRPADREPLTSTSPFKVELVKQKLQDALAGPKTGRSAVAMPDAMTINRLTAALNRLHATCFAAQEESKKIEGTPSAKTLFDKLRKILPEIAEYRRTEVERASEGHLDSVDHCMQAIGDFLSWGTFDGALHRGSFSEQLRSWHWCAGVLDKHLKDVIGTNAAARFIADVVPTLTGERPGSAAVRTWLLRRNQR